MKTIEQKIAEQELKLARLKDKAKKERNGAMFVLGGMLYNRAKESESVRAWLISELENLGREQDKKRTAQILAELKQL